MKIETWKSSKYFKNNQFPYFDMFDLVSDDPYESFHEFAEEVELFIESSLKGQSLEFQRYPEKMPLIHLDFEERLIYIRKSPTCDQQDIFLIGEVSCVYPSSSREKPSGLIFNDYSYLQIEMIIAHQPVTKKIYILHYAFHYGRMGERKEDYYFRFDKESDYQFIDGETYLMPFKPLFHFHGNAKNPHFPDCKMGWSEKIAHIVNVLSVNLERLKKEYGEAYFRPV